MDKSKLFRYEQDNFMVVVAEGNAPALTKGIQKYKESGEYRKEADFSPIMRGRSPNEDFMAVNIYGKRFCTMTVLQHHSNKPNTSLVCSGNKELPLEFLVEFAETIGLKNQDPSKELIREAQASQSLLLILYKRGCQKGGEDFAAEVISASLKIQHQKYLSENIPNN